MPAQLHIRLFGGVHIIQDGEAAPGLPSRPARALLLTLACQPGPMPRERLMDLFWPESDPKQAAANLRSLLSVLKKNLGDYLIITRYEAAFNHAAAYTLDVQDFERGMAALKPAIEDFATLNAEQLRRLEETLALYRGDFLAGFSLRGAYGFEEWAMLERERLGLLARAGLRRLAQYDLDHRRYEEGLTAAAKLLALDNLNEDAHRQMMWLLVRNGQRNAALRHYQRCRSILEEELGAPPAAATTALNDRLAALTFPPPAKLPRFRDPFFGREQEMARLQALLSEPGVGPITLLGPGGIGKTRLAVEAARWVHRRWPGAFLDGVFFIPLTALTSPEQLILSLAEILGLSLQGVESPAQQTLQVLRNREMLLIFDNFEHLISADSRRFLESLRFQCPGVQTLLTSRERLKLSGEQLIDLGGFSCKGEKAAMQPPAAPALRLFLHHAGKVQREINLDPDTIAAIVQLCALVDGMPLALQLAAGLTRHLPIAEIVRRVARDVDALEAAQISSPRRHDSIRTVFSASYATLSAEDRALLVRLTVFRGSFSADAANAVAGAELDQLHDFGDKSLLRACPGQRFAFHPLLQRYLAEKMTVVDSVAAIHCRHAEHYAEATRARAAAMSTARRQGRNPQETLAAIQQDIDNIRAAWRWAIAHAQRFPEDALIAFTDALGRFFEFESWYVESVELYARALDHLTVATDIRGRWLRSLAQAQFSLGQTDGAESNLMLALQALGHPLPTGETRRKLVLANFLARQVRRRVLPPRRISPRPPQSLPAQEAIRAYDLLSRVYYYQGDRSRFSLCILSALSLAEKIDAWPAMARNYANLCMGAAFLGKSGWAEHYRDNAHALAARIQDAPTRAYVFLVTGVYDGMVGDWAQSEQSLLDAQQIYANIGDLQHWEEAMTVRFANYSAQGRFAEAETGWRLLIRHARQVGNRLHEAWGLSGLAIILLVQNRSAEAEQATRQSIAYLRELGNKQNLFSTLVFRALAQHRLGRRLQALTIIEEALILMTEITPTYTAMVAGYSFFVELLLTLAAESAASQRRLWLLRAEKATRALEAFTPMARAGEPRALLIRGLLAAQTGDVSEAKQLWRRAAALARSTAMPYDEARAQFELGRHLDAEDEKRRPLLLAARAGFEAMGADYDLRQVDALLNRAQRPITRE